MRKNVEENLINYVEIFKNNNEDGEIEKVVLKNKYIKSVFTNSAGYRYTIDIMPNSNDNRFLIELSFKYKSRCPKIWIKKGINNYIFFESYHYDNDDCGKVFLQHSYISENAKNGTISGDKLHLLLDVNEDNINYIIDFITNKYKSTNDKSLD